MSKPLAVVSGLLLLGAAAATVAARPAPAPRPPHDRTIFFSSGGSWLGVSIADITGERVKELNLKEETGAEIKAVMPGSPAEQAGLEKEDVILEYQGNRVEGAAQLTRLVRETPPGRTVTLKVSRAGETRTVRVKVTEPEGGEHERIIRKRIEISDIEIPHIEIPDVDIPEIPLLEGIPSSFRLGVSVENLTGQLGEYFGVKDGEGVLVRSVKKGSPADSGGLRAGDVIVRVDGEKVADSSDLRSALRGRRGKTFPIGIMRDKRETSVTVSLPRMEEPALEEGVRQKMEKARMKLDAARARMEAARLEMNDAI